MNVWDRIVAAVAPERAVRRAAARSALVAVEGMTRRSRKRYQESSHYGSAWGRNTGKVEDALPRLVLSRMRIRRLLATNPYATKVRNTLLNNLVGFGITGTPAKGAPKKVAETWRQWIRFADWRGRLDLYGLQELAVGTMIDDGEAFVVRRFDTGRAGVAPTRIEVFDAGMLFPGTAGKSIEYDDHGRPTKYHFRKRRVDTKGAAIGEPVSFDAKDVIHLYRQDWPGQMRGLSIFEPVIKRFEDIDDYIDAEVVRKKIEACFAVFITPSADVAAEQTDLGGQTDELSANDFEIEVVEPGMIERLRPGDEVTFADPKPSPAIAEFARVTLLGATAGAGVTYEAGTGDLSNVNYSSYRAGSLEFQRFCGRLQWLLLIPVMCERIWDWFLEDGYQTGLFGKRWYPMDWMPPAFESIDRGKDAKADILEMAAGLSSRRKLVGARGWHFEDLMAEIAEDTAFTEALKLAFQGDPRAGRNAEPKEPGSTETDPKEGSNGNGPEDD